MRDVGAERYLPLSPCFIPARPRSPQSHPQASAVDRYPEIRHGEGKGITVGRATHLAVRGDDKQESLANTPVTSVAMGEQRWALLLTNNVPAGPKIFFGVRKPAPVP